MRPRPEPEAEPEAEAAAGSGVLLPIVIPIGYNDGVTLQHVQATLTGLHARASCLPCHLTYTRAHVRACSSLNLRI